MAHSQRRQRGQAIVETALAVPLMVLLLLGAFVGGAFVTSRVSATNAARQGARIAALLGGQTIDPAQSAGVNQGLVDARILSTVLAAAKLPNSTITEIDIYCQEGPKCTNSPGTPLAGAPADGSFVSGFDYDKFDGSGNPDITQQSFTLDKRTQAPPDEASVGLRIKYAFTSPINGTFSEFTQTLIAYAVMKAGSVLV